MALRRKKSAAELLTVFQGITPVGSLELSAGSLQRLQKRALAAEEVTAKVEWETTGQLGLRSLKPHWPDFLAVPDAAYLRRGRRRRSALELVVELGASRSEEAGKDYLEDLARFLEGADPLRDFAPPAAAKDLAEEEEPLCEVPTPGIPATDSRDSSPAVASPPGQAPVAEADAAVAEPSDPPERPAEPEEEPIGFADGEAVEAEVLSPGERLHAPSGNRWQQSEDDVFGLAGEVHPEDAEDHGLEVREEDLPWLNPGDGIVSPRRGPCRIKRVEDEARQVVAKDENGQLLVLDFRELVAEFQFRSESGAF